MKKTNINQLDFSDQSDEIFALFDSIPEIREKRHSLKYQMGIKIASERARRGWTHEQMSELLTSEGLPLLWMEVALLEMGEEDIRLDVYEQALSILELENPKIRATN